MASIATVVTRGFGSFGSVNLLPTLGYGSNTIELGPLCICAVQAYLPSSVAGEYSPGANAVGSYTPDSVTQGNCC